MILAVALASISLFLIVFAVAKVVPAATMAITTATDAAKILADKNLDDASKESASQKAAIGLLGSVFSIGIRSAVSILAGGIPIYIADVAGLVPAKQTIDFLMRVDVIIISSVIAVVLYLIGRRLWPTK